MRKALFHRRAAPGLFLDRRLVLRLHVFGEIDQSLRRVVASIEKHILHPQEQFRLDRFVNRELPRVHDPDVQPGANRVIEKRGVHRFAHRIVAAERERNVADATACARTRKIGFDPADGLNEIDRVIAVLLQPGRDGKHIRIENDVVRREAR